jgi:hypothetical protein
VWGRTCLKEHFATIYLNEHVAAGSMRLLHLLDSIGQQFYFAIVREVFAPTKKFDRLFHRCRLKRSSQLYVDLNIALPVLNIALPVQFRSFGSCV